MRVTQNGRTYLLEPDGSRGWMLSTIKLRGSEAATPGAEAKTDTIYPSSFPGGLKALLERMVADGLAPDATLTEAVATVAHLYATIGDAAKEAR